MNIVQLLGNWEGRIGRATYALAQLAFFMIGLVAVVALGNGTSKPSAGVGILLLLLLYPGWVIAVKRAHDLDRSGWWVLGWACAHLGGVALLLIGTALAATGNAALALLAYLMSIVVCVAVIWNLFVKMFFFRGSPGMNRFGAPEGENAAADAQTAASFGRADEAIAAALAERAAAQRPKAPHPLEALETKPERRGLQSAAKPSAAKPQGFGRRGMKPA